MAMHKCEVWIAVDHDGAYGVGVEKDLSRDDYESQVGDVNKIARFVKVVLDVETKEPSCVTATVPENSGDIAATVTG